MSSPKWALVTGVSPGGMGEGEVKALLDRGVSVIATALDVHLLVTMKAPEGVNSPSLVCLELDVTSPQSISATVAEVESVTGGRLDFLINNAGYGYYMPLLDVDVEKARRQYEVNVWGVLAVTKAFFPLLRIAKGTVVNQASVAGVQGYNLPFSGVYCSSKAAVHSLSDTMRVEFAPFDVKVVTLVTGGVRTEFFTHKEGGSAVTVPSNSLYHPIRQYTDKLMQGSMAGSKGSDRFEVTRSTVAALLKWPAMLRTRFVRRGFGAIKFWLFHLLFPTWLLDRWARKAGGLDKLKQILNAK